MPDRGQPLLEALRAWRERARSAVADYGFHMAISGWDDRRAEEMRAVVEEHGIPSFKVLMAYKGTLMVDDGELYQVMKHAARLGAVVLVHAENGDAVAALQQELRARGDLGAGVPPGLAAQLPSRARPRAARWCWPSCTAPRPTSCT